MELTQNPGSSGQAMHGATAKRGYNQGTRYQRCGRTNGYSQVATNLVLHLKVP